jgi:hypothetical protein
VQLKVRVIAGRGGITLGGCKVPVPGSDLLDRTGIGRIIVAILCARSLWGSGGLNLSRATLES